MGKSGGKYMLSDGTLLPRRYHCILPHPFVQTLSGAENHRPDVDGVVQRLEHAMAVTQETASQERGARQNPIQFKELSKRSMRNKLQKKRKRMRNRLQRLEGMEDEGAEGVEVELAALDVHDEDFVQYRERDTPSQNESDRDEEHESQPDGPTSSTKAEQGSIDCDKNGADEEPEDVKHGDTQKPNPLRERVQSHLFNLNEACDQERDEMSYEKDATHYARVAAKKFLRNKRKRSLRARERRAVKKRGGSLLHEMLPRSERLQLLGVLPTSPRKTPALQPTEPLPQMTLAFRPKGE